MGNNTLLAGATLMLLLLVPVWLSPQESLHPSRRTLILLGVAGGLVSIAAFEALRWNAPELHIVAYPTATAFMALFFGVPAAAITASSPWNSRLRFASSPSKAPAAVSASRMRLFIAFGLMRLAKSEIDRNGLVPRCSTTCSTAAWPTPLTAASA